MARYFIIAGEASGDIHAADLVRELLLADPQAEIRFFGGDLMAAAAGVAPEIHYRQMAYMGFAQVIKHLPDVRRNLARAREIIDHWHPDAVVLIDYPSFNLRVARHARKRGIETYYYIPPKVWAWKEHRVKAIRRDVSRVFSILPFERAFYGSHGMDVEYVGNPSVAEVDSRLSLYDVTPTNNGTRKAERGKQKAERVLALLPGSRRGEILGNLPVMLEVARRHSEFRVIVSRAPGIEKEFYDRFGDIELTDDSFALMRRAYAALVTSGTATLECALIGTPQVACYRSNGSWLTYAIMSRWLKIPFVTLPNLIACDWESTKRGDKGVIPEMLLHHCNADEVDAALTPLLADTDERRAQIEGYRHIRRNLGSGSPACVAARAIVKATG